MTIRNSAVRAKHSENRRAWELNADNMLSFVDELGVNCVCGSIPLL